MIKHKIVFLFSGLPHYFNFILNRLNDKYEIHVIIPNSKLNIGKGVLENKSNVHFQVWEIENSKKWFGKSTFDGLSEQLETIEPDIVVFTWPYVLDLIFNISLFRFLKRNKIIIGFKEIPYQVPKVSEVLKMIWIGYHNEDLIKKNILIRFFNGIFLMVCRLIYYKQIDFFLNYTFDALEILPTYGVKKENIYVTFNSIETKPLLSKFKLASSHPKSSNDIIFFHIGRLVKWKNVDLLINSFDEIFNSGIGNIQLWIIGSGPEEDSLKRIADIKSSSTKIKFWGAQYGSELHNLIIKGDIYILAGAGGLSINEAMCFGKPVICTYADGTEKMLVKNEINGFIIDQNKINEIKSAMLFFIKNHQLIEKFGNQSINIIENEINEEIVLRRYEKAFDYNLKKIKKLN